MSALKERIPFLKEKTLDEYNHTILMPSFNMMELYENAKTVGISADLYKEIIRQSKNKNTADINYKVMRLIHYVSRVVFDDVFVQKTIKKIIFIVNYGQFNCQSKSFAGTVSINDEDYKFALEIDSTSITYASEYNNHKIRGRFSIEPDGIKIKYNEKKKRVLKINNLRLYDIENNTHLEIYNKKGEQNFEYNKEQKYNYYKSNNSDKKIINEINPKQNYTKYEYIWRCPKNTIIKKREVKYQYPKDKNNDIKDINEVLIGKSISPNSYKIPSKGKFYHLEYKLFLDYCSNRCDINTLWENILSFEYIK